MTIHNLLRNTKNFKRYDGEVGLEIETETKSAYMPSSFTFWDVKDDGSLRDFGKEYVLKQPLKVKKELPEALKEFAEKTKNINFIQDSISTSVHVHLNVLNEPMITFGSFLTAYTLVENLLIRYSGDDRRSNLFCLPICDAEETYKLIVDVFKNVAVRNYQKMFVAENQAKYAALNLASFNMFGSVEIRSFRGTTDVKLIENWVNILYCILEYARKVPNPKIIMEEYKLKEANILDDIFGPLRKELGCSDEFALMERNAYYAASIAYSVPDKKDAPLGSGWEELDKIPENKPKYSPKDVLNLAESKFGKSVSECSMAELDWIYTKLDIESSRTKKPKSTSSNIPTWALSAAEVDGPLDVEVDDL